MGNLSPTQFQGFEGLDPPPLRRKTNFYFYRVLDGLNSKVEGFKPSQWEICPQPNSTGLRVCISTCRGKQISVLYRVLDGLDPQLEGFKPSHWKILGPTQFQGFEGLNHPHTKENNFSFVPGLGRFGPPTGRV